MGASEKTGTLELSQYVTGDKLNIRGDYNADMRKIDQGHVSLAGRVTEGSGVASTALSKAQDALDKAEDALALGPGIEAAQNAATAAATDAAGAVATAAIVAEAVKTGVGLVAPAGVTLSALNSLLTQAANAGLKVTLHQDDVLTFAGQIVIPPHTHLDGNGATLKNDAPAERDPFISILGVEDVTLENFKVDGKKSNFSPSTEWKHGIQISNSRNIRIRNVESSHNKGDGIYIGDNLAGLSSDITLENVLCDYNHRQGLSITHGKRVSVYFSTFSNTSGTAPMSGVDVESNVVSMECADIKFVGCFFTNNAGCGVIVSLKDLATVRQGDVSFTDCTATGNVQAALRFGDARDVVVTGGYWGDGPGVGVDVTINYVQRNIIIQGATIARNAGPGVRTGGAFNGLSLIGCTIVDNATSGATADTLTIAPGALAKDFKLIGCTIKGINHRYGINVGGAGGVNGVMLVGNSYEGYTGTVPRLIGSSVDKSNFLDLDLVGKVEVTGSKTSGAALTSLLVKLAEKGLIINNTVA